jgi:hypothetical protein
VRGAARLVVAALLVSISLTSCGGGKSEAGKAPDTESSGAGSAADVSTCTDAAETAATPYGAGFPQEWPFPPGTVVYDAEDRGADGTNVSGVSSSSFEDILDFLNHDTVDAGFEIEKGETEEHDAEAEWRGNGFRGRWAVRESVTCPGETVIQVLSATE